GFGRYRTDSDFSVFLSVLFLPSFRRIIRAAVTRCTGAVFGPECSYHQVFSRPSCQSLARLFRQSSCLGCDGPFFAAQEKSAVASVCDGGNSVYGIAVFPVD